MHELAATRALLESAQEECEIQDIKNPHRIVCSLGTLTTFKPDPIHYYYDQLKKEYPLFQHTILDIELIEATMRCNTCKRESEVIHAYMLLCPLCESSDITITKGKDFIIKSIIR